VGTCLRQVPTHFGGGDKKTTDREIGDIDLLMNGNNQKNIEYVMEIR